MLLQAIGDVPWPLVHAHVDKHVFSVRALLSPYPTSRPVLMFVANLRPRSSLPTFTALKFWASLTRTNIYAFATDPTTAQVSNEEIARGMFHAFDALKVRHFPSRLTDKLMTQ